MMADPTSSPQFKLQSKTPWLYWLIRCLFVGCLKVFYASIVVENADFITADGEPTILCANHSNSLTDALLVMVTIPLAKRKWVRMTAKSTLFGKKTFSSWLIESVGSVPIKRAKDYEGKKVDNIAVLETLSKALAEGDMISFFPEGISHYSPGVAPLRSGVARITSDLLRRNADNPNFQITLLTCSITYLHRENFRSDVLVSFNPPIKVNPRDHHELFDLPSNGTASQPQTPRKPSSLPMDGVKQLTALMEHQICQGTIDAPNFGIVRIAHTARRLYAPLGTRMTLGDTVHVTQLFVDAFAHRERHLQSTAPDQALFTPLPESRRNGDAATPKSSDRDYFARYADASDKAPSPLGDEDLDVLAADLHAYQDILKHLGLKDDRIRQAPLSRTIITKRLFVRLGGALFLFAIASPGLVLWLPIFVTAGFFGWRMRSSGRIEDVWDEIAHTKLIYGLLSGVIVWMLAVLVTLPAALITVWLVPVMMWFSLRWLEDGLASLRAAVALLSMLAVGKKRLRELRKHREKLRKRVMAVAVQRAGLPADPEVSFDRYKEGTPRSATLGYFSIRRRRKRDWNETLRLWDNAEYPNL